jgi:hypothetical protein
MNRHSSWMSDLPIHVSGVRGPAERSVAHADREPITENRAILLRCLLALHTARATKASQYCLASFRSLEATLVTRIS